MASCRGKSGRNGTYLNKHQYLYLSLKASVYFGLLPTHCAFESVSQILDSCLSLPYPASANISRHPDCQSGNL